MGVRGRGPGDACGVEGVSTCGGREADAGCTARRRGLGLSRGQELGEFMRRGGRGTVRVHGRAAQAVRQCQTFVQPWPILPSSMYPYPACRMDEDGQQGPGHASHSKQSYVCAVCTAVCVHLCALAGRPARTHALTA